MADWKTKPSQEKESIKYRDYGVDNTPGDFSSFTETSDADLKTIFNESRKRQLYIYPLNTLIKNSNNSNLYFSANTVKIGFIDLKQVKKVVAYEVSDFVLELDARNPTNVQDNTVEYTMVDAKTIVFQDESLKGQFNLHVVSIDEEANEDNLDNLYIINSYTERYAPEAITVTKETVLVRIKDFKVRGSNPIVVRIAKQLSEDTKVKAIKITYPQQTLFGNIKVIGEIDGVEGYPKLFLEDDKVALPMLAMPIEVEPKVRILQQWMSSQILPWVKAKKFFNENSALDLIKIGGGNETRKKVYTDVRVSKAILKTTTTTSTAIPQPPKKWPVGDNIEIKDNSYNEVARWSGGGAIVRNYYKQWITTTDTYKTVELEFKYLPKIDSLQKVLLQMLNYTYNYRTNFKHAEYWNDDKKQFLYGQPKNAIAKLKEEKFVGQKPEVVITNLFEDWKFDNPKLVKHPAVQTFKQIILMLSEYIFSELSINMGLNDDYKILLPYYFELVSQPIVEDGEYKFKDVEVVLKSEYFDFSNDTIKLKNNDISENKLFKLNSNQFNWLPLINNLEPNDIPSLLPKDIKLADGNYGKNFVNLIVKKSKVRDILNFYGEGLEDLFNKIEWSSKVKNVNNSCKFKLNNLISKFKKIEISSIFGSGNYSFEIETEKENIKINDISLFNQENNTYIILEI